MTNPYETDLDKNPANYQPLTPLTLLKRAAGVWPEHTAVIHGRETHSYHELYRRSRRLASALAKHGIGVGDTVSVMLPNVPAMVEAHYGVAMCGIGMLTLTGNTISMDVFGPVADNANGIGEMGYDREQMGEVMVELGFSEQLEVFAKEIGRLEAQLLWAQHQGMDFPPYVLASMRDAVAMYRERGSFLANL